MSLAVTVELLNNAKSKTLSECLDGIFSNKVENFEVIVVDDKSTDNSVEIAKNSC